MNLIHTLTIKQLKERIEEYGLSVEEVAILAKDSRNGVQYLLKQHQQRQQRQQILQTRWTSMSTYEERLRGEGYTYIAGMDEVGRGPLAGPVTAAAVILPSEFVLLGLNDSKQLSLQQREQFYDIIIEESVAYSIRFIDAQVIDEINIHEATKQVMRDCILNLDINPDICLVDGRAVQNLSVPQIGLTSGDTKSVSIAAASVIAKVERDRWMKEASNVYPQYGFGQNVGYGTLEHLVALEKHGPCPLHRMTFGRVREYQ